MPDTVHLYVFDGFAELEAAFAVTGIHHTQFQREPGRWRVRTVGLHRAQPVRSMGGLLVLPDLGLEALQPEDSRLLILPGGDGWEARPGQHHLAVAKAIAFMGHGTPVAAICGATAGLARAGLLDQRPHTSNAAAYLKGTGYAGTGFYRDEAAVCADGLITAGGMAPLEFAREVFRLLDLYEDEALDAWYQLYRTGESAQFARLSRAAQVGG